MDFVTVKLIVPTVREFMVPGAGVALQITMCNHHDICDKQAFFVSIKALTSVSIETYNGS